MKYLTYIRDSLGQNYIGLKIEQNEVQPYLDELKGILGDEEHVLYTDLQQERDNGEYHITVINVAEYHRVAKMIGMREFVQSLELVLKYEIDDLDLLGLGKAESKGNTAYFIVSESDKLDAIRTRFELPKRDFHITLGFYTKDIFGVPKNILLKK